MRSPQRPLWSSGLPWTRTLLVVIAVLLAVTVASVYVPPLAELLHLEPFPTVWWLAVALAASSTAWLEPLKRRVAAPGPPAAG
jgi:hypothetical protein